MTNPANAFQPAIDALEKDLGELERQANGSYGQKPRARHMETSCGTQR